MACAATKGPASLPRRGADEPLPPTSSNGSRSMAAPSFRSAGSDDPPAALVHLGTFRELCLGPGAACAGGQPSFAVYLQSHRQPTVSRRPDKPDDNGTTSARRVHKSAETARWAASATRCLAIAATRGNP